MEAFYLKHPLVGIKKNKKAIYLNTCANKLIVCCEAYSGQIGKLVDGRISRVKQKSP
jgi:hypothetical protein